MAPRLNVDIQHSDSCISAEEISLLAEEETTVSVVKQDQRVHMKTRWQQLFGQLTRTNLRGNVQPMIG